MISIHAPRVGSDDIAEQCYNIAKLNFNPRSPCGERPSDTTVSGRQSSRFQSTLPVWGATQRMRRSLKAVEFQSTLPVWGATHRITAGLVDLAISIHAPRVGSDGTGSPCQRQNRGFQSTLPVWGATPGTMAPAGLTMYFNPRSPCGERPFCHRRTCHFWPLFQSTLPVWGATGRNPGRCRRHLRFQSTLPVWGATWSKR